LIWLGSARRRTSSLIFPTCEELVRITKGHEGRRSRTWAEVSERGEQAFATEGAALKAIGERFERKGTATATNGDGRHSS
jgi:hypothetical protein